MKEIKVSLRGTSDFLKYTLLAIWQGWRVVNIKRVPKPTEYIITLTPPNKRLQADASPREAQEDGNQGLRR